MLAELDRVEALSHSNHPTNPTLSTNPINSNLPAASDSSAELRKDDGLIWGDADPNSTHANHINTLNDPSPCWNRSPSSNKRQKHNRDTASFLTISNHHKPNQPNPTMGTGRDGSHRLKQGGHMERFVPCSVDSEAMTPLSHPLASQVALSSLFLSFLFAFCFISSLGGFRAV